MPQPDRPLVYVEWIDSEMVEGWQPVEDVSPEFESVHTIGWLVAENDQGVTIAAHLDETGKRTCDVMRIPHVAILRRWAVEFTKGK